MWPGRQGKPAPPSLRPYLSKAFFFWPQFLHHVADHLVILGADRHVVAQAAVAGDLDFLVGVQDDVPDFLFRRRRQILAIDQGRAGQRVGFLDDAVGLFGDETLGEHLPVGDVVVGGGIHGLVLDRQFGSVMGAGVGELAEELLRHHARLLLDHVGRHQPARGRGRVDEGHALALEILDRLDAGVAGRDEQALVGVGGAALADADGEGFRAGFLLGQVIGQRAEPGDVDAFFLHPFDDAGVVGGGVHLHLLAQLLFQMKPHRFKFLNHFLVVFRRNEAHDEVARLRRHRVEGKGQRQRACRDDRFKIHCGCSRKN